MRQIPIAPHPAAVISGPHLTEWLPEEGAFRLTPLKIVGHGLWIAPRIRRLSPPYASPYDVADQRAHHITNSNSVVHHRSAE